MIANAGFCCPILIIFLHIIHLPTAVQINMSYRKYFHALEIAFPINKSRLFHSKYSNISNFIIIWYKSSCTYILA